MDGLFVPVKRNLHFFVHFFSFYAMARGYRRIRRLGGSDRLGGMGTSQWRGIPLTQTPFKRKRPGPPTTTGTGAPLRLGRRVRLRTGARSFTATRRRRPKVGNPVKRGENSSASSCRYGYRNRIARTVYKRITGRRTDYSNSMATGTSTMGRQGILQFNWGQASEITAIKTAGLGGTSSALPYKIFIGYVKQKLTLRNQSNNLVRMCIYDITFKRFPFGTATDTPLEAWNKGMLDFGVTDQSTYPYATPFRSPEFGKLFRVVRSTAVHMEPGQQHEHTVYKRINTLSTTDRIDNSVSNAFLPPYALFTLVTFVGALVSDSTSTTAAPIVSYGTGQLDAVVQIEVSSGFLHNTDPAFVRGTNTLVTSMANPRFMGEQDDAAMAPADVPGG